MKDKLNLHSSHAILIDSIISGSANIEIAADYGPSPTAVRRWYVETPILFGEGQSIYELYERAAVRLMELALAFKEVPGVTDNMLRHAHAGIGASAVQAAEAPCSDCGRPISSNHCYDCGGCGHMYCGR